MDKNKEVNELTPEQLGSRITTELINKLLADRTNTRFELAKLAIAREARSNHYKECWLRATEHNRSQARLMIQQEKLLQQRVTEGIDAVKKVESELQKSEAEYMALLNQNKEDKAYSMGMVDAYESVLSTLADKLKE